MMYKKIKKVIKNPTFIIKYIVSGMRFLFNLGSLPNYIIIGVQKGGTTSLQKYLTEHPDISNPSAKEVHYFDNNYKKGMRWYKKHFPFFKKCVGESTPYYIYHPLAAKRMAETISNVKLIILLRNPVDRAFSHYKMEFNRGNETRTFKKAINAEESELKSEYKKVENGLYIWKHQYHSYVDRGKYVDQLNNWLKYFDKKNVLVIKSEDLQENPKVELSKIFKFLNLKEYKIKNKKRYNVGKSNMKIDNQTKKYLQNYFKPYNKKLYCLLNKNFHWE